MKTISVKYPPLNSGVKDGEVEFGDYIDVPSDIDISSEDLIEVISSEDKS